jgi:ABC-2 type transport system permease protein
MVNPVIQFLAFFSKEFNEIRRQPKLVFSLIVGPLLVLILVGIGYTGVRPPLRVALVIPDELRDDPRIQEAIDIIDGKATGGIRGDTVLVDTSSDQEAMMELLHQNKADVVQALPADFMSSLEAGKQIEILTTYNVRDPYLEGFIVFAGYREAQALNDIFLRSYIEGLQESSGQALADINAIQQELDAFTGQETVEDLENLNDQLAAADLALAALESSLPETSSDNEIEQRRTEIQKTRADIEEMQQDIEGGAESVDSQRVSDIADQLNELETALQNVQSIPAPVIAEPFNTKYENLAGKTLEIAVFFAPAVLAFIVQHIAITLGALSLVRERQRGTQAFYGVTPISVMQVLIGKYIAYTLFCSVIAAGLTILIIYLMDLPFLTDIPMYAGYTLVFIIASIGIGFLISVIADSDIQAVQLAMLVLLAAVFFGDFVLPRDLFEGPVREIGVALPVTHAIQGYRELMLNGVVPSPANWLALSLILAVTFVLVSIIWQRTFRTQEK